MTDFNMDTFKLLDYVYLTFVSYCACHICG